MTNSETRNCQNCKSEFVIEADDFKFYEKIKVPPPTFCPNCRLQRRLASRNERFLHRRKCGLCGKQILSIYAPEKPYVVYCPECWWSDKWDPMSYAREYDFSRPFFEQYDEFKRTVPHESVYQTNFVRSEYSNFGLNYKDCYLVFGGFDNERLYYANQVGNNTDSFDIAFSRHLELSYETIHSYKSSRLRWCRFCEDSTELTFCVDCRGCISCFGCVGLRNKKYHIFNQPYTKDEYEEKIKEFNLGDYVSFERLKAQFEEFLLSYPYRYSRMKNAIGCTGDNIINSKNCIHCFALNNVEDSKYLFYGVEMEDSYDSTYLGTGGAELLYEVISSFGGHRQICGIRTLFDQNSYYSEDCHNSLDIFGCIGLKRKSYCIFNKQYTHEEYQKLLPRIIEHMNDQPYVDKKGRVYRFGEFWPIELSPFGYNETKAQEYFPLTKEEVLIEGYNWRDIGRRSYEITIPATRLPQHIKDATDAVAKEIIGCLHEGNCNHNCTTAFKIVPAELEFCRRLETPFPRLCPNCRHFERLNIQNPLDLWHRDCSCEGIKADSYRNTVVHFHSDTACPNEFETSYAPARPEIVYCEQCYNAEVV